MQNYLLETELRARGGKRKVSSFDVNPICEKVHLSLTNIFAKGNLGKHLLQRFVSPGEGGSRSLLF